MAESSHILLFQQWGWIFMQALWISTVFVGSILIALKLIPDQRTSLKYHIGIGTLCTLIIILGLLNIKHAGILPPLGLADWGSPAAGQSTPAPLIEGLPTITGFEFGTYALTLYYWIGVLWFSLSGFFFLYYLIPLIAISRKCRRDGKIHTQLMNNLRRIRHQYDLPRNVAVGYDETATSPATGGLFDPFLLVPRNFIKKFGTREREVLLLHELIHIKYRDPLLALFQHFVKSIFLFQPLVWRLGRQIDYYRELRCDQEVVEKTNDFRFYGETLLKLKLWIHSRSATPSLLQNADLVIKHRIQHILNNSNSSPRTIFTWRYGLAFIIIISTLLISLWNSYHLH